jgi:hypothetical protein
MPNSGYPSGHPLTAAPQSEALMVAVPIIVKQPSPDNVKFDRPVYVHTARRSGPVSLVSTQKEDPSRAALLEYAAFVLEQEARYCQQ